MGKIIETSYHDTVEKITGFNGKLLQNTFYVLNDKKPTIVTYYNINKEASSLDPGSKLAYDNIGKDTPIRFNKIEDFIIYGFDRIELNTDIDEFGIEADKITGDCFVLPNTIFPTEGDYFEVEHITDAKWLFIVTDVQQDTLQNGSNAFKLTYKLEYVDHDRLLQNVVENYKMIEKREGTNIAKVVESTKLAEAKVLDKAAVMLKKYYMDLFYNEAVQTFIYQDLTEWRIYDPYMIEFLIRNRILDNGEESYIHVDHKIAVPKTFNIDYDKCFLRAFEEKDTQKLLASNYNVVPLDIIAYGSVFHVRYEQYFQATYTRNPHGYSTLCIPEQMIYRIADGKLVTDPDTCSCDKIEHAPLSINILIKYFAGEKITAEEINSVYDLEFSDAVFMFYYIPLLILALEDAIETLLK